MTRLSPGDAAPDFTLTDDRRAQVSLADLRGRKVIVYFYPAAMTPGCTKQACGFRDNLPDFSGIDAVIIGVSKDSVASHDKFKKKYELPFTLASDQTAGVAEKYEVWKEKSMYGKKYMGIERSTFLIDGEGVIRGAWRKVKVDGHTDEVLKAAKSLPDYQ